MKTILLILATGIIGCTSTRPVSVSGDSEIADVHFVPGPSALVYKTKADYFNLVPVLLSDDKTAILSYPHPNDVKTSQGYLVPVRLKKGYLLDKKGIGKNVAFLRLTYEEYAGLQTVPPMEDLENLFLTGTLYWSCAIAEISRGLRNLLNS